MFANFLSKVGGSKMSKKKKLSPYNFDRAINTAVAVLRGKSTAVSPKTARATIRLAFDLGYFTTS